MIVSNNRYNILLYNIDNIIKQSNKDLGNFLLAYGQEITFDFKNKNNKQLYTHYFIKNLCNELKELSNYSKKLIYYNNILSKDEFRNKLIQKINKIFGIKIYNGYWELNEFIKMLDNKDSKIIDNFELFITNNEKPKTLKHIKKFLLKEGLTELNDSYFKDIVNKITLLC